MIPLAVPNLAGNESAYLAECVRTNFVSSVGPFVDRFEAEVSELTDSLDCVATSSGTTGLHLALTVTGVKPGDLVILPSLTFIASANAISHCGATPWLMDVTTESWTLDPEQLLRQLTTATTVSHGQLIHRSTGRRVAAILPVYTLGLPADMDAINAVASQFSLPVVADAAAALGARYQGRNLGELASISVLSFNGNKTFTCGGGGALFGRDVPLLQHARHLSTTARSSIAYDHDEVGFNYRLTNVQAAIGVAQLEQAPKFLAHKRAIDAAYRVAIDSLPDIECFPAPEWGESACWLSGLVAPKRFDSSRITHQFRSLGVDARTFWKPIHLQGPYASAPRGALPVSEGIWQQIVTLPSSTSLSEADLDFVLQAIVRVLD